jgi:type IV pilus assembly protein PilB
MQNNTCAEWSVQQSENGCIVGRCQGVDGRLTANTEKRLMSDAEVPPLVNDEKMKSVGDKDLVELMTEKLSWQTIRDVLAYDVNRPIYEKTTGDLTELALSRGWLSKEQHQQLKQSRDDVNASLAKSLVDRGLITGAQLTEAQVFMSRTGQPLWRTLLQLKMTPPQEIVRFLRADIELPFGHRPHGPMCEYLIDHGICSDADLDKAWEDAKASKTEFVLHLQDAGMVTREETLRASAAELRLPYDSLEAVDEIDDVLLQELPNDVLLSYQVLPYKMDNGLLHVAFSNPRQLDEVNKIGLMVEATIQPVLAPPEKLSKLRRHCLAKRKKKGGKGPVRDPVDTKPPAEMLTLVLRGLVNADGSDVHLEPGKDLTRVRYRVDGMLHDFVTIQPEVSARVVARLKGLANMQIEQRFIPQDGHLNLNIDGAERNFRISTLPTAYGEKVAIRLVRKDFAFSNFHQLGMNDDQAALGERLLNIPSGLVLTAGPVGSGKTTTLYSCLNRLDCFNHNIMTIEDPVEFELPGVIQAQVNVKRGMTFATGVRALLRQDADVLMVGEIRDEETAQVAIRAAMSGTLVLSSIHASSATAAVGALSQLGIGSYAIGNALSGVVFQRLVNECKESFVGGDTERKELGIDADEELTLHRGIGCPACFHTGYHGRVGAYEMIRINETLRQAIYSKASNQELRQVACEQGMFTLADHLRSMVLDGVTSLSEMSRTVLIQRPDRRLASGNGIESNLPRPAGS